MRKREQAMMSNIKEHFVIGSQRHYSSTKRDTKFLCHQAVSEVRTLFQTFRNLSFAVLKLQLHRTRQWVSLKNNKIQCVTHTKNVTSPPSDGGKFNLLKEGESNKCFLGLIEYNQGSIQKTIYSHCPSSPIFLLANSTFSQEIHRLLLCVY